MHAMIEKEEEEKKELSTDLGEHSIDDF